MGTGRALARRPTAVKRHITDRARVATGAPYMYEAQRGTGQGGVLRALFSYVLTYVRNVSANFASGGRLGEGTGLAVVQPTKERVETAN